MNSVLLLSAAAVGILLAIQAAVNLQLSKAVGTPYGAATIQLSVALVLLAALATFNGDLGALTRLDDVAPWKLVGGIASPFYITSAIVWLPRLGALASVGLFVTGQMLVSLLIDYFGGRPLTAFSYLGALVVIAGISVIVKQVKLSGWMLLGLAAGGVLPLQATVNAALMRDLGRPLAVGLTSFAVATAVIAAVFVVLRLTAHTPAPAYAGLSAMPWWGWLGGAAAAAYVVSTFLLVPAIGAATTISLTVTGQQAASAMADHYGWFRLPPRKLNRSRGIGLSLLVIGSVLVHHS